MQLDMGINIFIYWNWACIKFIIIKSHFSKVLKGSVTQFIWKLISITYAFSTRLDNKDLNPINLEIINNLDFFY